MVVGTKRTNLEPKGIKNVGNTCFFNAAIQCLLSINELVAFYKGGVFSGDMPISRAFSKFLVKYSTDDRVCPEDFISAIGSKIRLFNSRQQDSHEFVVRFLEALHDELSTGNKKINSKDDFLKNRSQNIITELFYSFNKQSLTCSTCSKTSETYAISNMVQIDVAETTQNGFNKAFKKELIDGSGVWKCDFCSRSGSATKELEVLVYPKVFILCIQRFTQLMSKNTKNISVDNQIVLHKNSYFLVGVVNHAGTLNEGHYTADAKRLGKWVKYNDSNTSVSSGVYGGSAPYLLFYSKP